MDKIPRLIKNHEVDKLKLFGLLLLNQITDPDRNISISGHKYIKEVIGETTLETVIEASKDLNIKKTLQTINNSFSYEQKFFVISNMLELAHRNRSEHEHEISHIKEGVKYLNFPQETFEDILNYCQSKIFIEILD